MVRLRLRLRLRRVLVGAGVGGVGGRGGLLAAHEQLVVLVLAVAATASGPPVAIGLRTAIGTVGGVGRLVVVGVVLRARARGWNARVVVGVAVLVVCHDGQQVAVSGCETVVGVVVVVFHEAASQALMGSMACGAGANLMGAQFPRSRQRCQLGSGQAAEAMQCARQSHAIAECRTKVGGRVLVRVRGAVRR
jgi:hypothetical protein